LGITYFLISSVLIFSSLFGSTFDDYDAQIGFKEIWGYLMRGEEKYFLKNAPITDIFYFSAGVNEKGLINTSVNPPYTPFFNGGQQRIHIVISDLTNSSRMTLCLNKKYGARDKLIKSIVEVSKKFDGVQIDFEAGLRKDKGAFLVFLRDLKKELSQEKILSVAIPPKRMYTDDAYDYEAISKIADRILVMAYDQHWSKSKPGPVASLNWCKEVADYASKNIPKKKLIMGLPLYGREWQNDGPSRSIKWSHVSELLERDDIVVEYSLEEGFKVMYEADLKKIFYYDDIKATRHKLALYSKYKIGVGFWRLGMENADLWDSIIAPKN
jgi:spore germination protein YaaH